MAHFEWIEAFVSNSLRLVLDRVTKDFGILVESQDVLSWLGALITWRVVVLILDSRTSIETADDTVAEQARVLV